MNWPAAIVLASGLVSGAILLSIRVQSQTQLPPLWAGMGANAQGAWAINTQTGQVKGCVAVSKVTCKLE